jgi:AraC-like DNA-binding protein
MNLPLIVESYGPLEWLPAYPAGYEGLRLNGSAPSWSGGAFGTLLVQEVAHEHYRIRYILLRAVEKLVLRWREERALKLQVALHNDYRYQGDRGGIRLRPPGFNLVWAPEREGAAFFEKGREYRLFTTHFMPPLVQQLVPRFPGAAVPAETGVRPLEPRLNELVQAILANPYSEAQRQFFYENKVREILFNLLTGVQSHLDKSGFSEEEIRRVHQVDVLILSDLKKHYTIEQLAARARMSQDRLKEAFKAVIGVGMYERLKEARLQQARQLVLTTSLPIKAIFDRVGYETITGFIDAFKERFGLPPATYRKQFQQMG